jgi:hypothetical protein
MRTALVKRGIVGVTARLLRLLLLVVVSQFSAILVAPWTLPRDHSRPRTTDVPSLSTRCPNGRSHSLVSKRGSNEDNTDDWDGDVDYDQAFPPDEEEASSSSSSLDPTLSWKPPSASNEESGELKLGIQIGRMLEPLSEKEAAELKAAATEIINDKVAEGLDDIDRMRARFKREVDQKRRQAQLASEFKAQRESERLMDKIDALTSNFLDKTEASRASTRLVAAADRSNEGKAVEIGVWGNLDGVAVGTMSGSFSPLLGSIQAAVQVSTASANAVSSSADVVRDARPPTLVILANVGSDDYAKTLVPPLQESLLQLIPGLQVRVWKPTDTIPVGGDSADSVVVFATSFSSPSTVNAALDRILRKTLVGGIVTNPPTQLVVVSSLGTERTNKMPYSMQNLVGGGKLDQRRQIEEAVIRTVRNRAAEPPLDYTICKFGELKQDAKESFQLQPGDAVDGSVDVDTAVKVLEQAIACQPAARNATLSVAGKLTAAELAQDVLDDIFLRLDGPELVRIPVETGDYDQIVTYLSEWAYMLASTGKGLTTPVRAERLGPRGTSTLTVPGVQQQAGVRLLFLPTATGKNYVSAKEEAAMERDRGGGGRAKQGAASVVPKKVQKEGGVEIVAEVLKSDGSVRVRAKRCNYADDAVIKELSEETILSRLKETIQVWKKDHP